MKKDLLAEIREVFFYANEDVKYYDIAEELAQPCIDLIHDTMIELVKYSVKLQSKRPLYILDIGSGTGAEAFRLLNCYDNIHIVAIDFSPPMNLEFKRKFASFYSDKIFESKITLLEEDFWGNECLPEKIKSLLPLEIRNKGFDVVVAGFLLHHYPTNMKKEFYQRIFNILSKDGILVHGDLFGFQSKKLSDYAHDFGQRWITKQMSNPDKHLREKYKMLGTYVSRLCDKWIRHWNETHIYDSLFDYYENMKSNASDSHIGMLKKAGFTESDCPFRLWEAGIIWAKK